MSYLSPITSTTSFGVVKIGANINVAAGVISLPQAISTSATPTFASVTSTGTVTSNGNPVVESVTGTAGPGITITPATTSGPAASFTVNNTGVLSNIAGTGISVSSATGNVTIGNTGVTSIVAGTGVSISGGTGAVTISAAGTSIMNTVLVSGVAYLATAADEYIGVSNILPVVITLPLGITGTTYIIKDEYGAGFGGITIVLTGLETIDALATYPITVPLASITIVFRGTGWHVI
jgi:hypothetical protein